MIPNLVDLITLGCSKNLVDSERLIYQLESNGFTVHHDAPVLRGEIAIVNTCGFIGDAKEESVEMILELCQRKREGKLQRIYVMGCLSQRYFTELKKEIPEVDGFYGKFDFQNLISDLGYPVDKNPLGRVVTTPGHYAYLKISEGCDRECAYCAIPIITGHHVSRPMDEILDEVRMLVSEGVREFQVIAQELTYYGVDLYHRQMIAELIDQIAEIPGVEWIRLHYSYPAHFPAELLDVMSRHKNICRYMDIALQHISDHMLGLMHRHVTKEQTMALVEDFRKKVPGIHLRTTLMVGFPGETEEDFEELKEFVRWARFERMGAFAYSEEEGTYSAENYKDDVPEGIKQRRLSELMAIQQEISSEITHSKIGQRMRIVIDRREGDYYIGRTEFDSPEVDGEVLIPYADGRLLRGHFYDVEITGADEFDLYARRVK